MSRGINVVIHGDRRVYPVEPAGEGEEKMTNGATWERMRTNGKYVWLFGWVVEKIPPEMVIEYGDEFIEDSFRQGALMRMDDYVKFREMQKQKYELSYDI
jgi:uncharacterized protein YeeX (DUF496 family)